MSYSKSNMIQNPELFGIQIQKPQNSQLLNFQQRSQQLQQHILLQQQQGQLPQPITQLPFQLLQQQPHQQFQIQRQEPIPMQFTSPIALPVTISSKNDTLQPSLMPYQQQQAQTVAAMAMNNPILLKEQMKTPQFENYRKIIVNEIAKQFIKFNRQLTNEKVWELANNFENQIFNNSNSIELYKKLLNQQLQVINLKHQKDKEQQKYQQQPATITTQQTTPLQFPATVIPNKVNSNPVLLQNNNTISPTVVTISKAINNASPSVNTTKLASQSSSIQTIPKITQSLTLNNIIAKTPSSNNIAQNLQFQQKNQNIVFQQNQFQSRTLAQKTGIINQQQQSENVNEQRQKLITKIERLYNNLIRSIEMMKINLKNKISEQKKMEPIIKILLKIKPNYDIRNIPDRKMKDLEDLEKILMRLNQWIDNSLNHNKSSNTATTTSNIVQVQTQVKNQFPIKTTLNQTTQNTSPAAVTSLNNLNQNKVDTVNKTPLNQPKANKIENITENNKNKGLKASSSETLIKEEIEKTSKKTSNSSSTKKRNSKKSTSASSSPTSLSINLNSKRTELSTASESSSKKSTDLSKVMRKEKENSTFLRGIDRSINIFLLDNKDFKNHIKSTPKAKSFIQNSFKYIINSNSTAFGINSYSEDLSTLCFNNKDKNNDKPIKLENINDNPYDHVSLFEDIINRKSHIIPIVNKRINKKDSNQFRNETNNNDVETNNKRKIDSINEDLDTSININKKIKTDDKYSNIIEEVNYLKDQYKITVNVIDLANTASIIKNNNKSCEIPWNEFVTMINDISKEERELDAQTSDPSSSHLNNIKEVDGKDSSITTAVSPKATSNLATEKINNNERALLVITLNLSNYIDINEIETDYNIPGDNQRNIIVYVRIPKSTQQYRQHGIFDWNLSYIKKKSIFQTSDEDNKLKEKKIYKFISQKINDYQTITNTNTNTNTNTSSSQDSINNITMTNPNKNSNTSNNNSVIKVWNIIEWILESIKN